VHDISDLEIRGIPAMFVASTEFKEATKAQSKALGFDPAVVYVPHPIQDRTKEEMYSLADDALKAIINAISKG
jgi:hypothetical protein